MRHLFACIALLFALIPSLTASDQSVRFISDPTLSPDGSTVVFSYETDLWKVSVDGGTAYRLTAMEGREILPRISPDGRWIAFSSNLDGNTNVYVMPFEGGEITQLTFHQSADMVNSWSWDSQYIVFHSGRENMSSLYRIPFDGGTPERLFEHYHNIPHHGVQHPETGAYIFTESYESLNQPHRKRYRGEHRPDLLSYNLSTGRYEQITDFEGKDMWPTVDRSGNLYFASDENLGEYNLYAIRDGHKVALTHFDASIGWPQVSARGNRVVFEKDYQLFVYDVESGQTHRPEIRLFQSNTLPLEQSFQVKGNISWFDVSPDNKKLAFVSRGELFVSDIDGKFVRQMPTNPFERVSEVAWAADNKTLFYFRTDNGWANLYKISADGNGQEIPVDISPETGRLLTLSADRSKGVYLSGRKHVKVVDLDNATARTVVADELWGFQNSTPRFSPDGAYIVYTAYRNFEQSIFVHHLEADRTIEITRTGMTERTPFWSPCGRYIYFASDRTQPNYPRGATQSRIYRIPLYRFADPLRSDRFDALFAEKGDSEDENKVIIRIDPGVLDHSWEMMRVSGIGVQGSPQSISHNDHQLLFFTSNHDKGQSALWKMDIKDFEEGRPQRIEGPSPGMGGMLVEAGSQLYMVAGGNIHKMGKGANRMESIDITHSFSRNLAREFGQIFDETWAAMDENFYAEDFHGIDWHMMREQYRTHLPHVRTRDNLRRLINDMLGELNASHTGFSSFGAEERIFHSARSAYPGVVFDPVNPYRVLEVVDGSNLDLTDPLVFPGDILVAVNGEAIDFSKNRDQYFYFASMPEELHLTLDRNGAQVLVRTIPHTPGQLSNMEYDGWIRQNRKEVENRTGNRVAYAFMKDMSVGSLNQFIVDMTTHGLGKDGLILDLRFNRGGNVHDDVIQFLSQRTYLNWQYRGGAKATQPNFTPSDGPIVLLINERSLSDAEMTAAGFKELELGTIVGTETYRWIIFTSGKSMVDGSSVRMPGWGCYTLDGDNLELTGVAPDVNVHNTFEDRLLGRDPQLDRAIEIILNDL